MARIMLRFVGIIALAWAAVACSSSKKEPAVAAEIVVPPEQQIAEKIYNRSYRQAVDLASEIMARDGVSAQLLTLRGIAYAKINEPYRAYEDLIEASRMDRSVDTLINAGNALRLFGHCERALDAYRQALALSPDNPEIIINMTNAYLCLEQLDMANDIIQKSFPSFPGDAVAFTNVSILKSIQRDFKEARKAAELAVQSDASYRPAYQALYQACLGMGDSACAKEAKDKHKALHGALFRSKKRARGT